MILRFIERLRLRASGDEGIAMIMVMGTIMVMSTLLVAALGYAMNAQPQMRHDQDWNAALAAAQSGVDDYVARLNQSDSYWQTVDCTNPALKGPAAGTNTCSWTATTTAGFQDVQPGNAKAGSFHYDVDASTIWSKGAVQVTSTGKVNNVRRTIQVLVSRGGSTDYLYYTDFEDADPANTQVYGASGTSRKQCGAQGPTNADYWWENDDRGCVEINFVAGDKLDGAVHTNDTPLFGSNATFVKGFETSDPDCKKKPYSISNCKRGSGTPDLKGNQAQFADLLYLPDNSDMFKTFPGCQFTGDTRIKFNNDGTMKVWSTNSVGTTLSNSGANCGTASGYAGNAAQTVPVPYDKVIYVRNTTGSTSKCTPGQVGDGIPMSAGSPKKVTDANFNEPTFYCGSGNVYVEGTVKGRVTIAAQNNVIVTGDLLLDGIKAGDAAAGNNMVGLVSGNSVVIYHPIDSDGDDLLAKSDKYVYASIQTLQHSFWVQSYSKDDHQGTLHVRGSLAQKWRGIVGTSGASGSGYLKDYSYDTRLKFSSPPYFPQWTNAVWRGKTTGELKPQY